MKLLALIPLLIIIVLTMIVLYFHTMAIQEQIKWKTLTITTFIEDVLIYMTIFVIIGFCINYIISI